MSEQKQPRRPGGRRPVPPLIFLLLLAILALFVWWKVIRTDEDQRAANEAPCSLTASPEQIAELQNMGNIKIHVLNGSDQQGLAASIQTELTARGFSVLDIGNASGEAIPGGGVVRYGTGNEFQAMVVAAHLSEFSTERSNDITDGTLSVIAGPGFAGLVDPAVAGPQIESLIQQQANNVAGCPSSALELPPTPTAEPAPPAQ